MGQTRGIGAGHAAGKRMWGNSAPPPSGLRPHLPHSPNSRGCHPRVHLTRRSVDLQIKAAGKAGGQRRRLDVADCQASVGHNICTREWQETGGAHVWAVT